MHCNKSPHFWSCFCSKYLFEFASSLCLAEKSKRGVGDDVGEVVGLVVAAVLHPVAVQVTKQDETLLLFDNISSYFLISKKYSSL